jgi:mannose-6-phosphate isomerase
VKAVASKGKARELKSKNQHAMPCPLRFLPYLRPMVWGGRRLADVLGKPLPGKEPYGESWEISDHALHHSEVATGPWAGRTLRQLMEQECAVLLGAAASQHAVFPWLVKFLDACDWLSVQVHPDEETVRRLWPGEGSKTEAWFVLEAAPGSRIYAGLLPGIDETRLREALATQSVADCLHHFEPHPGDCVFLPAGTVHAVGGGVLLAEVQQTSDATFRLFDWNRCDTQGNSRKLHIEEALACIDWQRGPVEPIRTNCFDTATLKRMPQDFRQSLVRCSYFHLEYRRETKPFTCGGEGKLQLVIPLQGRACLPLPHQEEVVTLGQAWLLPAAMPAAECQPDPDFAFLFCTLP